MLKRLFDLSLAFILLLVLSIPMMMIALLVKITSPGPILYWSKRIGRHNKIFRMAKYRTMRTDTPQLATHLLGDANNYLTPIGSFLRRTSLDELPQLLNIFSGHMSFVGPRPALYNQHDLKQARTKVGVEKLLPGITGWAQVNGRDEISISEKVNFDSYYLKNHSFIFDLKVIFLTFIKVVRKEGVSH